MINVGRTDGSSGASKHNADTARAALARTWDCIDITDERDGKFREMFDTVMRHDLKSR